MEPQVTFFLAQSGIHPCCFVISLDVYFKADEWRLHSHHSEFISIQFVCISNKAATVHVSIHSEAAASTNTGRGELFAEQMELFCSANSLVNASISEQNRCIRQPKKHKTRPQSHSNLHSNKITNYNDQSQKQVVSKYPVAGPSNCLLCTTQTTSKTILFAAFFMRKRVFMDGRSNVFVRRRQPCSHLLVSASPLCKLSILLLPHECFFFLWVLFGFAGLFLSGSFQLTVGCFGHIQSHVTRYCKDIAKSLKFKLSFKYILQSYNHNVQYRM